MGRARVRSSVRRDGKFRAARRGFVGADGVFILPPSEFDSEPGYPEARAVIDGVTTALTAARPNKVLCLSTIGADAPYDTLLTQRTLMEQALSALDIPVTFLRPGWFMENALWDVAAARDQGVLQSFLQPADKLFPMVATTDIGALAAELIRQDSHRGSGRRFQEGRRGLTQQHSAGRAAIGACTPPDLPAGIPTRRHSSEDIHHGHDQDPGRRHSPPRLWHIPHGGAALKCRQ